MNTLADQVVEFTIALVRALHRTAKFDPSNPHFPRLRARMHRELGRLMRTQPEIGYVVGPPVVAGGAPEVWVDGTAPQRIELRRAIGPSVGGAFILQLLEFLQQRGLAGLAFQRGVSEPEWNAFLEVVPGAVVERAPAGEARRLINALVDKKVQRISLVSETEQPSPRPDVPWYVRLAYARLARDLRTAAALGQASPAALMEQSERLTAGMGYSYFRKRIRALLLCANTGIGSAKIIPRAVEIVSKDARGAPPQVVRAAIEVVVRRREAGALQIGEAEAALCHLAAPIGFFGRMFGQTPPPAAVLVTAIVALGRLGTDRAEKLLVRLGRSKDPDGALAARNELERKISGRPPGTMPALDTGTYTLDGKSTRG